MKRGLLLVAALFMVAGTASGDLLHHWPLDTDGEDIVGDLDLTIVGEIADGALQCADKEGAWGEGGNCFQTDSDGPWTLTYEIQTTMDNAWVMGRVQEGASGVDVNQGGKSFLLGFYAYIPGQPAIDDSWRAYLSPDDEAAAVNDGEWHHVGISHTGANMIQFWVDGVSFPAAEFAPGYGLQDDGENEGANDYFNIAGAAWMPAFEGAIRNVRYYDEAADQDLIDGSMAAPAPSISASITGPHNVDVGAEVVLEVVTEGFDEGTETYLWNDDSTAATLDLGVVDGGDTGVYTCEVGGDVDGEALEEPIEASFTLWVGVATPLAGGLGVALLAGACALAGAVSIRRKK